VGVIPEDWEVKQIGDLQPFVTSGSRGWAVFYSDRGAPFIRITNLSRASIYLDLEDLRLVNLTKNDSEAARTQVQDRDILISITADIGIIGYVSARVPKPAYINQHIALVRFDPSQTNSKFVSYFLASEKPQKLFRALTDSGAKAGMNLTTVQQIRLALPPTKAEQEAIAEALSDTDALIESLEQLIAKKRWIKQGAMQELLTGKRRLLGFATKPGYKQTEVGVIPEDWEVKLLPDVCRFRGGKAHEQHISELGRFVCVNSKFISTDGKVRKYSTANFCCAKRNDVLMVMSDLPNGQALAKAYLVDKDDLYAVNQRVCALTPYRDCPKYLFYVLNRNSYFLKFDDGVNQTHLLNHVFQRCPLAIPPTKAEQEAIATILSDMDAEITALEAKLAKARQIKQGMMQELLTGKVRLV
jgi:type I restriction enzyme S subunit